MDSFIRSRLTEHGIDDRLIVRSTYYIVGTAGCGEYIVRTMAVLEVRSVGITKCRIV